jgi:hypothetical protein
MAISDIPEYVEVATGDLIRADHWNNVQRQTRNGLRTHRHTHVGATPRIDTATTDEADQISTAEIADGAVTTAKLASGAITSAQFGDGSITGAKLADNSIGTNHLQNFAVTFSKLSFETISSASVNIAPGATVESPVQLGVTTTKSTFIFFPTLTITSSSGSGISNVEANMSYHHAVGSSTIDVFIRMTNRGNATASVFWQVLTFTGGGGQ